LTSLRKSPSLGASTTRNTPLMNIRIDRRTFLRHTSISVAGFCLARSARAGARKLSPNDKLNIGMVGTANQANYDLTNVASENIVALCDVNDKYLAAAAQKFPAAKTYNDFRRLLDRPDLDAVVIAIPDHSHAVVTVAALKGGRHVYCEKPLTRTISECRVVMETTHKMNRVTQIGTQIHAGGNYRRVVELVQSGAVGPVAEVHVWVNATYGGKDLPRETPPVPPELHYDLWLGPVPERPYSPEYVPFAWRNWWAFGGGALADFGCHYMDLPHWALGLRTPLSAEPVQGPPVHPESTPPWLIVRYEYPAREAQPPVTLTWYHGGKQPGPDILAPELAAKWASGVLFIGKKGQLLADYGRHLLLPEKDFQGFVPPAHSIPDSIGHHAEWIQACKTGGPTTCNFDYSGALTEAALLGNVAYRAASKLEWDSKALRARNCAAADQFIQHHYRAGWKL
jgi:predicted dehydrogenase